MEKKIPAEKFKFDVFISYRHAELDSAVAGYLQKSLEHYRIPREIQKKCGKESIRRVFRDEEELGVASDLFGEIEENLKQSEFLLVICSPRIVESKWCLREMETFIKYRGRDNVLAVLIEGEPDTSFPSVLLEEGEPLAADLRGRNKREVLRHARERMPRLVAPLIYCTYDELYQRHRVYKTRRALALTSLTAVLALGFGAVTVRQNLKITENYQAKLENQSRHLAQRSASLLSQGDREAALLVALEALPESASDTSRPYVAEARIALENALYTYAPDTRLQPMDILAHKAPPKTYSDYDYDEMVMLTLDQDGRAYVWDGETNENLCCWEEPDLRCDEARLAGRHRVVGKNQDGVFCFDYMTRELLWEWKFPECDGSPCYSEGSAVSVESAEWDYHAASGTIVCVRKSVGFEYTADYAAGPQLFDAHLFYVLNVDTGESRSWRPEALYGRLEEDPSSRIMIEDIALSPDGKNLLLTERKSADISDRTYEDRVCVLPVSGDEELFCHEFSDSRGLETAVWLDDGSLGTVETLSGGAGTELMGYRSSWEFTCWDLSSGQPRFRHQDSSLALYGDVTVSTNVPLEEDAVVPAVITVKYDNVIACLDWYTGECYSHIEDRSNIYTVMDAGSNGGSMLLATADGYVFFTNFLRDYIFNPLENTQHYYLNLGILRRAEWHNRRAYFYTDSSVYCYSSTLSVLEDKDYVPLEIHPRDCCFAEEDGQLLLAGYPYGSYSEGRVCLYDMETLELLWQDACPYDMYAVSSVYTDRGIVAYMSVEQDILKLHSLRDGTDRQVPLENSREELTKSAWNLSAAGERVLVWNDYVFRIDTLLQREDLKQKTALWVVDAVHSTVERQISYGEIGEQLFALRPEMQRTDPAVGFTEGRFSWVESARITADGRCLVAACGDYETGAAWLAAWDLETGQPVIQPEEIQRGLLDAGDSSGYYRKDGWLSPDGSIAVLYDQESKLLRVADLFERKVLRELPVDGIGSDEVSFTPDGNHLIFQDAILRLCVYDWRKDEYTMRNTVPETGAMTFSFHRKGSMLSAVMRIAGTAMSRTTRLYRYSEEGICGLETAIGVCIGCDGETAVIQNSNDCRLYRFHDLDDLIAKAKEILNGRELTELERKNYLID